MFLAEGETFKLLLSIVTIIHTTTDSLSSDHYLLVIVLCKRCGHIKQCDEGIQVLVHKILMKSSTHYETAIILSQLYRCVFKTMFYFVSEMQD